MTPTLLALAQVVLSPQLAAATDPAQLPAARVAVDTRRGEIVIDLPPIDLPAHTGHHGGGGGFPPVVKAVIPVEASLYGFQVQVVDAQGRQLPGELIHHFNLIDPNHRELFLPISRRLLAAGKETGAQRLPKLFFGMPVQAGELVVASAMLHNPTETDYRQVRTRLVLQYIPGAKWYPIFEGYPFQLDVAFPVGDKSFPLPPGKSSRSYEGSPSIPGKIVGIGGHMHEMGTKIELSEVETGKVIWAAQPVLDESKNVVGVPVAKLYGWFRLGVPIRPDRKYRVTVYYDNPTGQVVEAGGMGVIGGLFLPDRGATWPVADKSNSLYLLDAEHYLRSKAPPQERIHEH